MMKFGIGGSEKVVLLTNRFYMTIEFILCTLTVFFYQGTKAIEAICVPYFQQFSFSKEAMRNMKRLRILNISVGNCLISDGSIEYLSNNLRWFVWTYYPCESLPENFEPKRLAHLELRCCSLRHLWTGIKDLRYLRELDLTFSESLMRTPDFTGMPNLEFLDLSFCSNLKEVDDSLGNCKKLIRLDLNSCISLERCPQVNVESLKYLDLNDCSSLAKFPEFLGRAKPELKIDIKFCRFRELPSSVILYRTHITKLKLSFLENLVALPSSIAKLKFLVKLYVNGCLMLESLPEDIGDLENLEKLDARRTLISRPPPSIVRLNKLKFLSFAKERSGMPFVFPPVGKGLLRSLEYLCLRNCNLIDGGLLEDIGCLSSLKELDLRGNNFEHLPQSIAQLSALQSLNIGECKTLTQLPEYIVCLSSLKELDLSGNNFEHLPQSIAQLGVLRSLDLRECKSLTQLPKLPSELHKLYADCQLALKSINNLVTMKKLQRVVLLPHYDRDEAYNDSIYSLFAHTLFQNLCSLQHDISASDSLSERVFTIGHPLGKFPSWFCYVIHSRYESVSVNLPENWCICDSFLGFAICYSGNSFETTVQLTPLCNDEMSWMTQKLSYYSECDPEYVCEYTDGLAVHFFFVPFAGLWDESKANGKTPNDYMYLTISGKMEKFGLHLLYKDEPELEAVSLLQKRKNNDDPTEHCIRIKRSRYDTSEHHDFATNEAVFEDLQLN